MIEMNNTYPREFIKLELNPDPRKNRTVHNSTRTRFPFTGATFSFLILFMQTKILDLMPR